MIIGANVRAVGGHLAGWRHPDACSYTVMNRENALDMARLSEAAKLHFIFLADGNGVRSMDKPVLFEAGSPTDRPGVFEPVTLLAACSVVTERVGLVATITTTYEQPFTVARKIGSLDHLSGGRAAWNVVTTSNADDALNFSYSEHMGRDIRYARAEEFIEVARGLWDSWADDAFVQNKETGQFLDSAKVHRLNHKGEFFQVAGPMNQARPPQGYPVTFSAGQSDAGRNLTAKYSDCMFSNGGPKDAAVRLYADIKGRMAKYGRKPDDLKILDNVAVYIGHDAADAKRRHEELQALISPKLGMAMLSKVLEMDVSGYPLDGPVPDLDEQKVGGTSSRNIVFEMARAENLTLEQTYRRVVLGSSGTGIIGGPEEIADQMQDWYESKACDGFVVSGPVMPRDLKDFCDLVLPILQKRGLFHTDYKGKTLRENLGFARPQNPFF